MKENNDYVLIVEDEEPQRALFQTAFSLGGMPVMTAENGQKGLEQIAKRIPAVIILDLIMPVMGGEEMLKYLKANPVTEKIPVIVFSNLEEEGLAEKIISLGAEDFIAKSNTVPNEIVEKIKNKYFLKTA